MAKKPSESSAPGEVRPLCFIIGPIGERNTDTHKAANWLLKGIFKPVLESEEFGYQVKRADEDASPGSIANAVILDVLNADLVIADLTGFNPNAFYELGLRHMTGKAVIHVIGEQVRLPFDNADQRTIFIDISDFDEVEKSKIALADMVRATKAEGYKVSNPVTQAKGMLALAQSGDTKDQLIAELGSRLNEMEARVRVLSIDGEPRRSASSWIVSREGEMEKAHARMENMLGATGSTRISRAIRESFDDVDDATKFKLRAILPDQN